MEFHNNKDKLFSTPISKSKNSTLYRNSGSIDFVVLVTTICLAMIGLIMVYSVTLNSGTVFLKGQIIRIAIGVCALIIGSKVNYKVYQGRTKDLLLIVSIILLILTLIAGRKVAEAKRWALFFQPAEIAKYTIIIWLTDYFANLREKRKNGTATSFKIDKFPLIPVVCTGLIIGLLLFQPAVGTSIILTLSVLFIFFIGGTKIKHLLLITIISIFVFILSILTISYAKKRFNEFRSGTTYQQIQSKIAIGSGGIFGKGLGEGKQKFYFLPKLHTDFIFSAVGEEFGFIGCFIIALLFFILFSRGIRIATEINDDFGQLLIIGIIIIIFQYLLVHIAVALSLIPTTGQPLPFISFGGSALATNLYAIGIVLNVSKDRRRKLENSFNRNRWNRRTYLPSIGNR